MALVTLLLPISKGGNWGWTSSATLALFATSLVVFAVFGYWQLQTPSPIVDLRTTARRHVLTTNLASIGVGFSLFALSLIAPQVLELPAQNGHGLGQSMLAAGLWMAPGGLAMMICSPVAATVARYRGPRFTLVIGCVIIALSYLSGPALLGSPIEVMVLNIAVSVGVGFAFTSLPVLINAAVPVSETAAANGINALARSLGTSVSSAVIGAVLSGMTMSAGAHQLPTLRAFQLALLIAAVVAGLAALLALLIPPLTPPRPTEVVPRGDRGLTGRRRTRRPGRSFRQHPVIRFATNPVVPIGDQPDKSGLSGVRPKRALMSRVWKCSTMRPSNGMVPASRTPMVLKTGQRTCSARFAVKIR